jgi:hypothetical protein
MLGPQSVVRESNPVAKGQWVTATLCTMHLRRIGWVRVSNPHPAEGVGVEPTRPFGQFAFKASAATNRLALPLPGAQRS